MNTYLLISTGRTSQKFELEKGCSLFAGSGPNSRIVLNGPGIHEIHCRFWMDQDGAFWVQDWNTGKTLVNETPIENEVHLNSCDIVSIGNFSIVPVLDEQAHERLSNARENASVDKSTQVPVDFPEPTTELTSNSDSIDKMLDQTSKLLEDEITPQRSGATNPEPDPVPTDPVPTASIPTPVETYDEEAFVYDVNGADETDAAFLDSNPPISTALGLDEKFRGFETDRSQPVDQNEAEMLQLEVEQLRFELSERNAQLTRLLDSQSKADPVDDEQTAKLVNRLEELLTELESSDKRVRGLEELLRVSDQATQHEREEREQLASWVAEIEERLIQREAEADAELVRVTNRLDESRTQFQTAESELKKVLASRGDALAQNSQALIDSMGKKVAELQNALAQAGTANDHLKAQVEASQAGTASQADLEQMEQRLRQEQVERSQERAEVSRERAELQRLKDDFERKLDSGKQPGEADSRIKAMRQHLRAIHEEEKIENDERKRTSLSGRISRLLVRSNH